MPRGDKSAYSGKQRRQAEHIKESYEARGVSRKEAERRAWATVNKQDGGAKPGPKAKHPHLSAAKKTTTKKTAAKPASAKRSSSRSTARTTAARKTAAH